MKFRSPRKFNANKIIKTPAKILSSLEKNNNTFPIAEAAAPRVIKTNEKPSEKIIVFKSTTFLLFSNSGSGFPDIYEIYPGMIGNTQGVKKLINPAPKAKIDFIIIFK